MSPCCLITVTGRRLAARHLHSEPTRTHHRLRWRVSESRVRWCGRHTHTHAHTHAEIGAVRLSMRARRRHFKGKRDAKRTVFVTKTTTFFFFFFLLPQTANKTNSCHGNRQLGDRFVFSHKKKKKIQKTFRSPLLLPACRAEFRGKLEKTLSV